jgi:hypothetical protein
MTPEAWAAWAQVVVSVIPAGILVWTALILRWTAKEGATQSTTFENICAPSPIQSALIIRRSPDTFFLFSEDQHQLLFRALIQNWASLPPVRAPSQSDCLLPHPQGS